jgi:uncharacterized NAD(P)/FAD-binding protein YdhS
MPPVNPPTIVIIGGGFSGALTAVHLLKRGFGTVGRLVLVNRSGAMARGVAYGTTSEFHVLNVPAGRMSAFDDDPESFVRFVRERGVTVDGAPVDGGTFVGRHLYGAYLESLLAEACAQAPEGCVERLETEVVAIEPEHDGHGAAAWVSLRDGRRIRAARVVLAVGNYPPEDPPVDCDGFFTSSRRYVRDPWGHGAFDRIDLDAPILLIGTGLTMVDVALQLQALGAATMTAVSRRGLLPASHRSPAHVPPTHDLPEDLIEGPANTRAYVRAVRRHVREKEAHGIDWRDTIAALRPVTARLWSALSVVERSRFLRHVRPFWEVHRHRMAPPLYDAFESLRTSGRVNVIAGRLVRIREQRDGSASTSEGVMVRVRPRGSRDIRELTVGAVVNCSGPSGDTRRLRDPLFDRLRLQGLIRPDPLGLGIDVGSHGALIDNDGFESPLLYYVGPFLRARDWEATAVPELRQYARQLADHLADTWDNAGLPLAHPRHVESPLILDTRR